MKWDVELEMADVYGGDGINRYEPREKVALSRTRTKTTIRQSLGVAVQDMTEDQVKEKKLEPVATFRFDDKGDPTLRLGGAHGKLWGALKACARQLYDLGDPDFRSYKAAVEMILTGWVHFVSGGKELSMSKRAGTFIALDDLLAELGADAARWYFASRGANVNMDVDIELAKRQSSENPVYYVQYAHARIASILRKATDAGVTAAPSVAGLLAGAPEGMLARVVARFPEVVEDAAAAQETQGITTYATELATAFHAFYRDARVIDADEPERSAKRLALADATRISLANALALLGISAPEAM